VLPSKLLLPLAADGVGGSSSSSGWCCSDVSLSASPSTSAAVCMCDSWMCEAGSVIKGDPTACLPWRGCSRRLGLTSADQHACTATTSNGAAEGSALATCYGVQGRVHHNPWQVIMYVVGACEQDVPRTGSKMVCNQLLSCAVLSL
jgi:hypothetical protein